MRFLWVSGRVNHLPAAVHEVVFFKQSTLTEQHARVPRCQARLQEADTLLGQVRHNVLLSDVKRC